jgi:hypothetical protein
MTEDWATRLVAKTDENGQVMFRGFAGNYTVTIRTENGLINSAIHVDEQASQAYTIKIGQSPTTTTIQSSTTAVGKAEAEQAVAKAAGAISKAKTEGRMILLDRAESLLRDSQKALSEENYGQARVLAEEANRAADRAVTWLVIPVVVAFAGAAVSVVLLLRKRGEKNKN